MPVKTDVIHVYVYWQFTLFFAQAKQASQKKNRNTTSGQVNECF